MGNRNRYVKIALAEPSTTNLTGGTVVGQWGEWLLIQRPDSKPRAKKAAAARKPRAVAASPKPEPSTSSPGSAAANG